MIGFGNDLPVLPYRAGRAESQHLVEGQCLPGIRRGAGSKCLVEPELVVEKWQATRKALPNGPIKSY